jgi:hypothetical protein
MLTYEVTCDRCRVVISADRTRLKVTTGPLLSLPVDAHGEVAIDLCWDCARALSDWLRSDPVE